MEHQNDIHFDLTFEMRNTVMALILRFPGTASLRPIFFVMRGFRNNKVN